MSTQNNAKHVAATLPSLASQLEELGALFAGKKTFVSIAKMIGKEKQMKSVEV